MKTRGKNDAESGKGQHKLGLKLARQFPVDGVPAAEIAIEVDDLERGGVELFDPERLASALRAYGLPMHTDPRGHAVSDFAIKALQNRRPLSAIRLGDAEFDLLSYGRNPATPALDRYLCEATILNNNDAFSANEMWFVSIREMLYGAIAQADIVGLPGVGPTDAARAPDASAAVKRARAVSAAQRGMIGQLRARRMIPDLLAGGTFDGKTIASAHFYLGVIATIDRLVEAAPELILVTSRTGVLQQLADRHPQTPTALIEVGLPEDRRRETATSPEFIVDVYRALPRDLSGTLVLIGAGPWSEIYCSWVKQRGGVGIDIGSGFDLLAGESTRPIHKRLSPEELGSYRLP